MTNPICDHPDFDANVNVTRLVDSGRFAADVRIVCAVCKRPFVFLGLEPGLHLEGARVSVDGAEARLAIAPMGESRRLTPGPVGFTIRGPQ